MLGICVTIVWRAVRQLKEVGLIAEKRQGFNKLNLIYIGKIAYSVPTAENTPNSSVLTDIENLNVRNVKKSKSRGSNSKGQDIEKIKLNKTDIKLPDKSL